MIRINLLSTKKKRKLNKGVYELILFVLVVGFVFVSCFIINSTLNSQILIAKTEVDRLNKEFKRLSKIKKEVDGFKKRKEELQKKIDVVKRLKQGQKGYYEILTNLEYAMPEDVWISRFDFNGKDVTLSGASLRTASVNEFILNLFATKMFDNIDLKVVKKTTVENIDINDFNITAKIKIGG
ncbi:MAG: type pilus assembly protein PilN [Deferribacteres bacterium]|jgi:type IV pilus assembly protein PilN|nr:Fimbrial assembly family protein [Deferribacteraceae bacterium]MDK2792007.1 type pilus assembly protein PilN [Deferribacteres bacterium]